ncbi:MAG: Nif3-like dinuclear metal center hexameric protein [Clostridiales bacterium]|nr:Nif3-like dinuclear metal center hexameric protein [Clostridiales bacterium]
MTCKEIMACIEKLAPTSYAESWDNVGLLVGNRYKKVHRIMTALDATDAVIAQAVEQKADMLVTHHPMIFSAMKRVTDDDFIGRRIIKLIQNDISYYAMHTNCDVCMMNKVAAEKIGITKDEVLEEVCTNSETGEVEGIGMVGNLKVSMTVEQLAQVVKDVFGIPHVRVSGNLAREVKKVAISTGAGKSIAGYALKKGAEVFISGDMDHHTVIDMLDQNMQIIDAGHYGTEHFMAEYMCTYLKKELGDEVEILQAKELEPFITL